MKVYVGCREYGYDRLYNVKNELQHYLDNVAPRYSGEFVEENKELAKAFISGKSIMKYVGLASAVVYCSIALVGLMSGDTVLASGGGHINTAPLDRFFNEIYWTMFKVLMYIATPVWAWVGYILALGGANNEKRTQAKKVGAGLIVGTAITASAPWATRQLFNLWRFIFA